MLCFLAFLDRSWTWTPLIYLFYLCRVNVIILTSFTHHAWLYTVCLFIKQSGLVYMWVETFTACKDLTLWFSVPTLLHHSPTNDSGKARCRQVTICSASCESVVLSRFLSGTGTDLVASFLLMSSLSVQSLLGGATSCSAVFFLHLIGHEPCLFVFLTAGQVPLARLTQVVLSICLYVYRQAHTVSHIHINITHCTFYTIFQGDAELISLYPDTCIIKCNYV